MNIIVSGGTGFIGRPVCAALRQGGHKIFLLTRRIEARRSVDSTVTVVEWNGQEAGAWEHCLDGADAIINLADAPIAMDAGPMSANGSAWKVRSFPLVCL